MTVNKRSVANAAKITVKVVLAAALTAVAALVVYIMVCNMRGKAADIFGVSILRVVTGSMEPSIHEGDFIIVRKTDVSELREGDIICFYSRDSAISGMPNTHRIVRVLDDGSFVTKGDANRTEDPVTVSADSIIGRYDGKVGFLRWINSFSSVKKLLFLAIIIIMTAAAIYEVRTIAKISSESRAQKEQRKNDEKQRLICEAIDKEKQRLYEQGYDPEAEDKSGEKLLAEMEEK